MARQVDVLNTVLNTRLRVYIIAMTAAGAVWLVYLASRPDWSTATLGEAGLFYLLLVVAGSFPLSAGPNVRSDTTGAVLFASVLILEPGVAALVAAAGIVTFSYITRFLPDRPKLEWYKFLFNASVAALYVGLASLAFGAADGIGDPLTPAVLAAAGVGYFVSAVLVIGAVSFQLGMSPLRVWVAGTRKNGLAELGFLAFGFLGAMVYYQNPWTILALVIPVAIIYLAFSRLNNANSQLALALANLETLQGRIANTSKLASIGAVSLDLAHQIKNPLNVLIGRLEMLTDGVSEHNPHRRHLDIAISEGWRIGELTQTFSSMSHQRWVQIDVSELLNESFGIAWLRSGKRIETRRHYPDMPCRVSGNAVLLREAFSNVFSNAMEAMTEGGTITIATSSEDGRVHISISDDGQGIPESVRVRLFEPFHSTKPTGSGLGLFAAKHIIEMHQGRIDVESAAGQGTSVTFELPEVITKQPVAPDIPPENIGSLPLGR